MHHNLHRIMKKSRRKRRIIKHSRKVKKSTKKAGKSRRSPKAKSGSRLLRRRRKTSGKIHRKKPRKKQLRKKSRRTIRKIARRAKKTKKARGRDLSLEQLFESPAKVQVMKLFFRNPETNFLLKEAARSMRMNLSMAKKQMKRLEKIGFLKTRQVSSRKQTFFINPNFDFFNELKALILKSSPVSREKILKAVRGLGKIRLVLLSGLLVGDNPAGAGSRADLLIVGDSINSRKLNTFIKSLEAEAGTDIRCVAMTTEEFNYRYDMYDRFIRDLISDKCEFLVNKLLPGI